MKLLISIFGLLLSTFIFAQDYELEIGEEIKTRNAIKRIYPINKSEFFSLSNSRGFGYGNYANYIERYKNNIRVESKKLPNRVEKSIAGFEYLSVLEGKPIVFLSDKNRNSSSLYASFIDPYSLESTGGFQLVLEDPIARPRNYRNAYQFVQSGNQKYCAVLVNATVKGDEYAQYKYVILDKDAKAVSKGSFELSTPNKLTSRSFIYLSNNANLYIGTKEFGLDDKRKLIKSYNRLIGMHLYKVNNEDFAHKFIDFESKIVTETSVLEKENGDLVLSGMYRNNNQNLRKGVDGIFYTELSAKNKTFSNTNFQAFAKDFITQGWTNREKTKAEKREAKGKGDIQLYNYKLRNMVYNDSTKDITGIAEQYYVVERVTTDARGNSKTTFIYYYKSLVIYKIDSAGVFKWYKKIPKTQISTNDRGYLSSISSYSNGSKLFIVYNDTKDNYTANGEFIERENLNEMSTRTKKNCVTLISLDLDDGNFNREIVFTKEEINAYLVPKLCFPDYNFDNLFLLFSGKRNIKFGKLYF